MGIEGSNSCEFDRNCGFVKVVNVEGIGRVGIVLLVIVRYKEGSILFF